MKIKRYSLLTIIVAALVIIGVAVACATSESSTDNNASAQNSIETMTSTSPSPTASDAATDNSAEVSTSENNKPVKRISLTEQIAAEKAAGLTVDGTQIGRVMVAPRSADENVMPVYYPDYGKYYLKRTNPDTGEIKVSIDEGVTWLFYRENEVTKTREISADGTNWTDLTTDLLASEYSNCMFYLTKNNPDTGMLQVSYDYGKSWLYYRLNDENNADEVSADGSTWQLAPTEW